MVDASSEYRVLAMGGDGIGPEIVAAGVHVLHSVIRAFDLPVTVTEYEVGESAFARTGSHLPDEARAACDALSESGRGAVLFGACETDPIGILRSRYDLFANLRPIQLRAETADVSPLRQSRRGDVDLLEVDLLIVRELVGGLYWGAERKGSGSRGRWASQELYYDEESVRRIVRVGLEQAARRRRRLTLVHKANVIPDVFAIWFDVLAEEKARSPEVHCEDMLVDNMAMQLVLRPGDFDVLLCSNLFGDILSDLGAGLVGSIGLLPSASLNENNFALYESVGGTAPTIAGQDVANPISTILSVALLCRHTLGDIRAAEAVETAVSRALERCRTADIHVPGYERVSTTEMAHAVTEHLEAAAE